MCRRERYEEQGWKRSNVLQRAIPRLELEYRIARYPYYTSIEPLHKDDDPTYRDFLAANRSMSWWEERDAITIQSASPLAKRFRNGSRIRYGWH